MPLSKDEILQRAKLAHEDVETEWGMVRVRELRAGEFDKYQDAITIRKGDKIEINLEEMTPALLAYAIIGEDGEPLFTRDEIKRLPARPLRKLYEVAQRLNGNAEDAEKN